MSFSKEMYLREEEQGFKSSDRRICTDCVDDEALKSYIKSASAFNNCDYCERNHEESISVQSDDVIRLILDGLKTEWDDPDNVGVPYVSAEDGYQGTVHSTDELFDRIGWPSDNDKFRSDLVDRISLEQWCSTDLYSGTREDALRYSWYKLSERIKHVTRYVFLKARDTEVGYGGYRIDPADILDEIGRELKEIRLELNLAVGQLIYRCRVHDVGKTLVSADELGPPTAQEAKSNRMNPVGIPVFYGATNENTALLETSSSEHSQLGKIATIGAFELLRELKILDLTNLPPLPSLYDKQKNKLRGSIKFLKHFVETLAQPISRDDKV